MEEIRIRTPSPLKTGWGDEQQEWTAPVVKEVAASMASMSVSFRETRGRTSHGRAHLPNEEPVWTHDAYHDLEQQVVQSTDKKGTHGSWSTFCSKMLTDRNWLSPSQETE